MWNGFLLQKGLTGTATDPRPRRLLPLKPNIAYSSHDVTGDGGIENKGQREFNCSTFMQGSLSNLAGVSGGTGVRVAKGSEGSEHGKATLETNPLALRG